MLSIVEVASIYITHCTKLSRVTIWETSFKYASKIAAGWRIAPFSSSYVVPTMVEISDARHAAARKISSRGWKRRYWMQSYIRGVLVYFFIHEWFSVINKMNFFLLHSWTFGESIFSFLNLLDFLVNTKHDILNYCFNLNY